jgi:hypothetical protein
MNNFYDARYKNPIVIPVILHIIIPLILLSIKAYNIKVNTGPSAYLYFSILFSLSFIRAIITISKLCKNEVNLYTTYFVVILDFIITCIYLAFSILSNDMFIVMFCLIYIMGFTWVFQELRTYIKNIEAAEAGDEEVVIITFGTEPLDIECCICYEGVIEGKMLSCGHIYHKECIDEWFKEKRICPYCRTSYDDCRAAVIV